MRELSPEEIRYITLALDEDKLQELVEKGRQYHKISPIIAVADKVKQDCQGYKLTITFKNGHFSWSFKQITTRKRHMYRYKVGDDIYDTPEDIIKALDLDDAWQAYKQSGEPLGAGPLNFLKRKQKIKVEKIEKSDNEDES